MKVRLRKRTRKGKFTSMRAAPSRGQICTHPCVPITVGGRYRQGAPGLQARDRLEHLDAGLMGRLVAAQRLEVGGLERVQEHQDLLGAEVVVGLGVGGGRRRRERDGSLRAGVGRREGGPPDVGAAAQELLDLGLVAEGLGGPGEQRRQALVAAQVDDRLARRVAVGVARGLQAPVIEGAAKAHLVEHLAGDAQAGAAQCRGGQ